MLGAALPSRLFPIAALLVPNVVRPGGMLTLLLSGPVLCVEAPANVPCACRFVLLFVAILGVGDPSLVCSKALVRFVSSGVALLGSFSGSSAFCSILKPPAVSLGLLWPRLPGEALAWLVAFCARKTEDEDRVRCLPLLVACVLVFPNRFLALLGTFKEVVCERCNTRVFAFVEVLASLVDLEEALTAEVDSVRAGCDTVRRSCWAKRFSSSTSNCLSEIYSERKRVGRLRTPGCGITRFWF